MIAANTSGWVGLIKEVGARPLIGVIDSHKFVICHNGKIDK